MHKRMLFNSWLTLLLLLTSIFSFAATPIPEDQAFRLTTKIDNTRQMTANFAITPGYYLYAKKINFIFTPAIANFKIPQGDFKYDNDGNRFEVLSGNVRIPIELQSNATNARMQVMYQGCSEEGFCYPPTEKTFLINFNQQSSTEFANTNASNLSISDNSVTGLLTDQNKIQSFLQSKRIGFILILFASIGLLLAFTPCVLPMIPILAGIIVGQKNITTQQAFFLSTTYVIGSALTYAVAGMIAAAMGHSLQVWLQQPIVIGSVSALFALLAFSLFGVYELRVPNRWQHHLTLLSNKQQGGTYIGVFIMGMLSTLIVSPCVTAPLVGVLVYIAQTGNVWLGASALFLMGIGMGLPLILIGVSAGKWLPKSGAWMDGVKKIFGFIMLAMAVWLLSRILSNFITHLVWSLYLISLALFFAAYLPRLIGASTMSRSIGGLIAASAFVVAFSGIHSNQFVEARPFIVVHNVTDLNSELRTAKETHRPVILDFYADWCESCVTMDKQVFDRRPVKQALKNYILLRADLSNNSTAEEALLKQYGVIAPPTVIFFSSEGKEINSHRIVGEINAKEFLERLQIVNKATCEKNIAC